MKFHTAELGRYLINGLIATVVHYVVLTLTLKVLDFNSAGVANFVAALFGITASFLGSRFFVFRNTTEKILTQVAKFSGLYGLIAVLHGLVMFIWADWYRWDYRFGFLIATLLQVSISYFGNKLLVFR